MASWPCVVKQYSVSPVSLYQHFLPSPACFGSILPIILEYYTPEINIFYDGNTVWVCAKDCQHGNN